MASSVPNKNACEREGSEPQLLEAAALSGMSWALE